VGIKKLAEKTDIHPVDRLVGHRLRVARTSRKLSQTQLGEASGITFQQVQKYEKGTNRVSASRLFEFATLLGVDISYFFEGAGSSPDLGSIEPPKFDVSQVDVDILRALWAIKDPQLKRKLLALITSLPSDGEAALQQPVPQAGFHENA
jgi:transcriptional regulator with XRE-family HTH domain